MSLYCSCCWPFQNLLLNAAFLEQGQPPVPLGKCPFSSPKRVPNNTKRQSGLSLPLHPTASTPRLVPARALQRLRFLSSRPALHLLLSIVTTLLKPRQTARIFFQIFLSRLLSLLQPPLRHQSRSTQLMTARRLIVITKKILLPRRLHLL